MCQHISNVQVAFQTPCCKRWFDCAECHDMTNDHNIETCPIVAFACKSCHQIFQKDLRLFEDEDERCPHCGIDLMAPSQTAETQN